MISKKVVVAVMMVFSCSFAMAQRASVSVDALKWALLTPNAAVEVMFSEHITGYVEATVNPFSSTFNQFSTKQVSVSPELRYYFKRPNYSHFIGLNAIGSIYDVGYASTDYNGRMLALGLVYGYSFYLGERWAATPSIGYGYGYFKYNKSISGTQQPLQTVKRPLLTKIGVSITYLIN